MILDFSNQYDKDIKRLKKRRYNLSKLREIHQRILLQSFENRHRDHSLKGDFKGYRECHVSGDWVVVYRFINKNHIELYRTGTHQDIFKKRY